MFHNGACGATSELSVIESKSLRFRLRKHSEVNIKHSNFRSVLSPVFFKRGSVVDIVQYTEKEKKISKYMPSLQSIDPFQLFAAEKLLQCIRDNNCTKLRSLLKKVNVAFVLQRSKTIVHEAAFNGCFNCVKTLIKTGFPFNTADIEGWIPLHAAVMAGNTEVVKYLISIQKNVNLINLNGISPLHIAVYKDNLLLVHLLVQSSADMFLLGKIKSPFQLAIDLKHTTILDYFILSTSNSFDAIKSS